MLYRNAVTGRVIRELRQKRGVSQEVLSGFASISRSHLAMIENGTKNPNVDTLWRIAEALELPLSELISLVEEELLRSPENHAI
ncbi:MAG: helix-turn-helix transcriptional regulator [Clostridia bacterium]|nr:helix-turn-helix transcriptional regulator [Clostridia bacterium]